MLFKKRRTNIKKKINIITRIQKIWGKRWTPRDTGQKYILSGKGKEEEEGLICGCSSRVINTCNILSRIVPTKADWRRVTNQGFTVTQSDQLLGE